MKFELSPDNRGQSDEVLLEDLRAASRALGVGSFSRDAYLTVGRFHPATIAARFGGWGKALEQAGLRPLRHFDVTREAVVADLQRVARSLRSNTVSQVQYTEHGRYSTTPVLRLFGNWNDALHAGGLEVSDHFHRKASSEDLFANLERVWRQLGRQPTVNDMFPPVSDYSAHAYKRRFGGWRRALEAFVHASKHPQPPASSEPESEVSSAGMSESASSVTSPARVRTVGWRLRWLVMRRDRFRCRVCGRSPATHEGTVLHVDHIEPWSRGGLSTESNLQTLCEACNIGKGAG